MVIVPSLPASFSSQSGSAIEQVKGSAIPGNANGSSITNSSFHTDILGSRITGYVATGNSTVPINKKVGSLSVVITLKYQDQAGLNSYLQELQDPSSPFYHHYLTHREFVQRYSPPAEVYNSLNKYLASRGFDTKTYSDRVSVGVSGSASQFDSLFHTSIMNVKKGNSTFYAPVKPVSLGWQYHGAISNVAGLSDEHTAQISPLFTGPSGSEVLFGSDLQAAYQLDKLYQARGYPTNETVATILWSGAYNGSSVAPFVPSDISYYFSHNLPPGEPEPVFYGLPVGGAPLPGPSAKNDSTRANYESTLDLEMAGSTAPGATLVEVYGPSPTMSYLDQAFAEILNPNYNTTLDNALSHVTAISNSWGGGDSYDSSWVQYEQESAARGITVLASSGDNGNTGNPAPGFPATVGYDSYGTLAVGGTQTSVAGNASNDGTGTTGIASQSVWYNSPSSGDGSQGGVSSVYSEPSWQLNSPDANGVITGNSTITGVQSGRGTPDVAAVGANMWMYMSTYSYGTGYYELWGTSVASPLDAGLIATMDHYTGSMEGFMNPLIYSLGQDQFQGLYNGPPPFYWIYNGSNGEFSSARGYNLVDGWGSINAYNLILAEQSFESVTLTESGLPSGTRWYVNLTNGQSFSSTSNSISLSEPSGTYGYTASSENGRLVPSSPAGQFSVNGSPVSLGVTFQGRSYSVVFSETGLPPPYEWYVNLSNGLSSGPISSSSYTASLPNGTYSYTVSSGNKSYSPGISSGSFTVQGAAMTVPPVSFSEVRYTFTFNEINLKPGMTWYLNVSGQHSSGPVSSTSYSLKLPNGTYSYTAASTDKRYVPSPSYGTATVNGGPG
ncbi:hypothetical protein IX51_00650 [uncultured archaeon]|nr:hypothetical protein IX51_00650 [uncultured archaeon]